jgi:hypothetical protein
MMPKAPIVVVTEVTARRPAMTQLSITSRALLSFFMLEIHMSPRKRIYRPIMISEASREKKTADLSLKNMRRFRAVKASIIGAPFPLCR